jgi:protein SCO1/2
MKWLTATALWLALSTTTMLTAAPAELEPAPAERAIVSRYLLMDSAGKSVTDRDFAGSFQLITFGYTYCPDICPTTLGEITVIMKRLGPLADHVQPIFITVDPERDTPEVLSRYTAFFHPRIIGLYGQPALIRRVADNFKVRYEKQFAPGSDPKQYAMDHTAGIYLLGPD